jgi:hypothetical protein
MYNPTEKPAYKLIRISPIQASNMIAQELPMWSRRFFIFLLLSVVALSALAVPRSFPANVKRGTMSGSIYPQILIDGQIQRLSPGAKIKSRQNAIIMYSSLMNNVFIVNYTIDNLGDVDKVWILTDEELANKP